MTDNRGTSVNFFNFRLLVPLLLFFLTSCNTLPSFTLTPSDLEIISPLDFPNHYILQSVHLVDVETSTIIENQDVTVQNGKITAVSLHGQETKQTTPDQSNRPFPVQSAKGLYLIPGLIDAHVHLHGAMEPPNRLRPPKLHQNAQRMLASGITTAIDLGGRIKPLADLDKEYDRGDLLGPDLSYSGKQITTLNGYPTNWLKFFPWPLDYLLKYFIAYEVENNKDIDKALDNIEAHQGSIVKVAFERFTPASPRLFAEQLHAICERARWRNLPVYAHLSNNQEAQQAIHAGVQVFTHSLHDEPFSTPTLKQLKAKGIKVIPTLGVFNRAQAIAEDQSIEWTRLTKVLTEDDTFKRIRKFQKKSKTSFDPDIRAYFDALAEHEAVRSENIRLLLAHDIQLMIGSDAPVTGWQAGAALHEELSYLSEAGLTPAQLLKMVTLDNARHLGFTDRGKIAEGYRADLVLLNTNPLHSLSALTDIEMVITQGKAISTQP